MLIFPERNFPRTLSKPLQKKWSWCVLRKWRQNTWRRIWERVFFRKIAGWHLTISWRIKLFIDSFEEFLILQLVLEISSFSEVLYKRDVLKNFSKFTDKLKKQSSGGVLSKDVLRNFSKFTKKHLCRDLFFNKVAGWKPETVRISHWRC